MYTIWIGPNYFINFVYKVYYIQLIFEKLRKLYKIPHSLDVNI